MSAGEGKDGHGGVGENEGGPGSGAVISSGHAGGMMRLPPPMPASAESTHQGAEEKMGGTLLRRGVTNGNGEGVIDREVQGAPPPPPPQQHQ